MSRIARQSLFVALFVLIPVAASADVRLWQSSFDPTALVSYHGRGVTGVIIVAAGDRSRDLKNAAIALRKSYDRSRLSELVMDDEALGSVLGLSDEQIVKRADHLPVSHVAVLRVYGNTSEGAATAVVTVYDKWGSVHASFAVKAGQPLSRKAEQRSAPPAQLPPPRPTKARPAAPPLADPPPPRVAEATEPFPADSGPAAPPKPDRFAAPEAEKSFNTNYIWFPNVSNKTGQLTVWDGSSIAWKGTKKKPLSGTSFYLAAGRRDLAVKYQRRNVTRWALIITGAAAMLTGAYLLVSTDDCADLTGAAADDCSSSNTQRSIYGWSSMGVGGAIWFTGQYVLDAHPVSAKQAQKIANAHNERLRGDLGLSPDYAPPKPKKKEPKPKEQPKKKNKKKKKAELHISPMVGVGGGGLVVFGRF
ncbi:MAG: hypothetical protein AAGC55_06360 [Myxococcota bacterium]